MLKEFSETTQEGLRKWARAHGVEALLGSVSVEAWAWLCYLMHASQDRAQWFPHGRDATIHILHEWLSEEARKHIRI